jgi:hypothetical protein
MYSGLRQLMLLSEKGEFKDPAQMLYALSQFENNLKYRRHVTETDTSEDTSEDKITSEDAFYSGTKLKQLLAHILVCKICNRHLEPFLRMLEFCIYTTHIFLKNAACVGKTVNSIGVPYDEYVLDADFDELRRRAYNGLTHIVNDFICKFVQTFMDDHL